MLRALAVLFLLLAPTNAWAEGSGAFVMTSGPDTIAIERFERGDAQLSGAVLFRLPNLRMDYSLELRSDATSSTVLLDLRRGTDVLGHEPRETRTVLFREDSVFATLGRGKHDTTLTAPRALPYVNPSVARFEQVVRRARVIGGRRAIVPLYMLVGGQTLDCLVTRTGLDSTRLSLGGLDILLATDADGTVLGGSIPAQGITLSRADALSADALVLPRPDYSAKPTDPFTATDVRIRTRGGVDLAGTFTRPKTRRGRGPIVILVNGSGQQDRDESLPTLRGYRPFREIAAALAERDLSVLRLDDRGVGNSRGSGALATTEDLANDIEDAIKWARARREVDSNRVAIVGHSEGGLIASIIAARDPKLRGIVMMASPAYEGRRVQEYQRKYTLERSGFRGARRDSLVRALDAAADSAGRATPWMRWYLDFDPLSPLRELRVPVLILQGETDRQVTGEQAGVLERTLRARGNRDVTRVMFPETNHLFLADPDGSPDGYPSLEDPRLRPEVLETLSTWLYEHLKLVPAPKPKPKP